jgi:hypothetical protein
MVLQIVNRMRRLAVTHIAAIVHHLLWQSNRHCGVKTAHLKGGGFYPIYRQ